MNTTADTFEFKTGAALSCGICVEVAFRAGLKKKLEGGGNGSLRLGLERNWTFSGTPGAS